MRQCDDGRIDSPTADTGAQSERARMNGLLMGQRHSMQRTFLSALCERLSTTTNAEQTLQRGESALLEDSGEEGGRVL